MAGDLETHSVWHRGELAVQGRVGVREKMATVGARVIRDYMPDQHREFFTQLPMIMLGAEDTTGDLWATALFGKPGFIQSPTERQLAIESGLPAVDPLASSLAVGGQVGLLGIEFGSKRRNRANGRISQLTEQRITVGVSQSFGNCPKYIQRRHPVPGPNEGGLHRSEFRDWTAPVTQLIQEADTFFIASAFDDGRDEAGRGVDVSHRGGAPGFVGFDEQGRLLVPDYAGNNFFCTLGNLTLDPRAGLLFLDFKRGHVVHITATAEVLWRGDEPRVWGNGERMLRLTLIRGCLIHHALPHQWLAAESD